ncbi:MAG: peptide-methionine (S)-S-oxide reductase [Mycobacterium sp.]|jgi:peptide-methionine (S)-S-oxide reductase|nr:peptide-methionine (S)-S-oxide reductase [Mycobacterium sp.]
MVLNEAGVDVPARTSRRGLIVVILVTCLALAGVAWAVFGRAQPAGAPALSASVPAPIVDEPKAGATTTETAVLAGGCFWGVQGVFEHVKGVTRAESGYTGGTTANPTYDDVTTETTGHAESVRITYDPTQVTYGQLLQVFFTVVQDPTQLNRQGPDEGTSYRSAIFPQDADQQKVADAYIAQLTKAAAFPAPIVTKVEPKGAFYPAEAYHQDFLNSNPSYPYIARYDMPKLNGLEQTFPALYSEQPVLVGAGQG